jgi:crotonobetainyl-CoA:carnitine CoA-transferase CaiB-like acyl-CoA transferase
MLDLTHMLSGPYCGMLLADLGVEAIKVEPPGSGEGTRRLLAGDARYHRDGMNAYFLTLNRNKKSVTMDLKSAEGLALFYELVRQADIVLDNFSAGVTERLKISHTHLAAINPRVITCAITGFGESGPARDWPADMVAQAKGGGGP